MKRRPEHGSAGGDAEQQLPAEEHIGERDVRKMQDVVLSSPAGSFVPGCWSNFLNVFLECCW